MTDDDRLVDPATDPGLRLGLRPPDATAFYFDNEAEVVAHFREGLFAGGLTWREERDGGLTTWQSPETPHCWVCFSRENGRLADIQVSFPEPDSAWGQRLAAVTVRAACRFRLSVQY
jgi:hypothetical protein